jgi:hypothetical protein
MQTTGACLFASNLCSSPRAQTHAQDSGCASSALRVRSCGSVAGVSSCPGRLYSGMPNLTKVPVQCYHCGYRWELPLRQPIIGAANGDTITFAPCSIDVECPRCETQGVNYTATTAAVTAEGIRGLFAILRSVSLTDEDLEKLSTIALEARENGTKAEVVAQQIKTSIPRLRPVFAWITSQGSGSVGQWVGVLIGLAALIIAVKGTATAPVQRPTIIYECPSGEMQNISNLLGQIADELRSAVKSSNTAGRSHVEPQPENPQDGRHNEPGREDDH